MNEYLPFLIAGLTTGAVYGLAGVGLVLTYKTSGIFNFAHGALATVGAYLFYVLHIEHALSWQLSFGVVVLVVGPCLGLLLEMLTRQVSAAPLAVQVTATVGLLLAVVSVAELQFPSTEARYVGVFFSQDLVSWGDIQVRVADLITFAVAVVCTTALALFFRWSRRGVQMRGVVDNPGLLAMFGTNPATPRRIAWVLGSSLVTGCGVLFAPLLPLNPLTLTFLVVAAFGAAAIGAFSNLPLTFTGGLVIGVLASLGQKWFLTGPLTGLPSSLPFIVLFVVLLVFPRRFLAARGFVSQPIRPTWVAPGAVHAGAGAILVAGLLFVPSFAGIHLTDWTLTLTLTIMLMSLSLLAKTSGQVSLCHVSFAAIGVTTFSHLAVDQSVPWLLALGLAGLTVVPVGALLAIPAIRLNGLYLALATFGFGLALQYMFYSSERMFGPTGAGVAMPRPTFWSAVASDKGYYYLVLGITVLVSTTVVVLSRTRLGRLLRGIGDSPLAVSTSGASANVTLVSVFCLTAFLAAVAGALGGVASQSASPDSYSPITSLAYFVIIVITVGNEPWNAMLAAALMILIPSYWLNPDAAVILQLIFGLFAIAFAVFLRRTVGSVPAPIRRLIDARLRRSDPKPISHVGHRPRMPEGHLELRGVTVRFGGVTAVERVNVAVRTGAISGLIGPNGAGKTTTFNAASGLLVADEGLVLIDGRDVTRTSTAMRARAGLGRTFQRMELLESLTVRENVRIGAEARMAGLNPLSHFLPRPGETTRTIRASDDAIEMCQLGDLARQPVQLLSTGQRRLVELARCLAGDFRIILMDEPSSGLDHVETRRFGEILRSVVAERGVGMLLVEHDIGLVTSVCDDVTVLDFGRTLFHGSPTEMVDSPVVQAAYLGSVEAEEELLSNADALPIASEVR